MNTESPSNSGYMLLFRGTDWHSALSPEQIQNVMTDWAAWFNRLVEEGTLKAGQPLDTETKIVSGKNRVVSDGPFPEAKEAIGGYFLLQVSNFDEALEIARQCPALGFGISVEVRRITDRCPHTKVLEEAAAANDLVAAGV